MTDEKAEKMSSDYFKKYRTERFVKVENWYETIQIYGMSEQDFLKLARPMDSNRHFIK